MARAVNQIASTPAASYFLFSDNSVWQWIAPDAWTQASPLPPSGPSPRTITAITASPNSDTVYAIGDDGTVWQLQTSGPASSLFTWSQVTTLPA
jgi:hypothetical protein